VERGQGRAYANGVAFVGGSVPWARACPRSVMAQASLPTWRGQARTSDGKRLV